MEPHEGQKAITSPKKHGVLHCSTSRRLHQCAIACDGFGFTKRRPRKRANVQLKSHAPQDIPKARLSRQLPTDSYWTSHCEGTSSRSTRCKYLAAERPKGRLHAQQCLTVSIPVARPSLSSSHLPHSWPSSELTLAKEKGYHVWRNDRGAKYSNSANAAPKTKWGHSERCRPSSIYHRACFRRLVLMTVSLVFVYAYLYSTLLQNC